MSKIKYSIGKTMLKSIISILGIIRKHVDNATKQKIDEMVNDSIIKAIKR